MRIVALVRRLRSRPDTPAPELLGLCDQAVLQTALALRQRAGTSLTVMTAGAAALEDEVLHWALASGADRAIRIDDRGLESADFFGVARALAEGAKHIGFDLILAGDRSENERQGSIGPAVAEWLSIPHLTEVREVAVGEGACVATRRDGGMIRTLKLPLPALLTVLSCPHVRPLGVGSPGTVEELPLATLHIQPLELRHRDRCLGTLLPLRARRSATLVADPDLLIARLRDDRLLD